MNSGIIETDIFAICLLALLFFHSRKGHMQRTASSMLKKIILCTAIMIIAEFAAVFVNGEIFPFSHQLNYAVMMVNTIASAATSFCWAYYTFYQLCGSERVNTVIKVFSYIPLASLAYLTVSSPFTTYIIGVDAKNFSYRGSMYLVKLLVIFFYLMASAVIALNQAKHEVLRERKRSCYANFLYSIIICAGVLIQTLVPTFSGTTPIVTICIVMVYLDNVRKEISLDPLTRLNNRGQFDKYIFEKAYFQHSESLYLIFIDIDNFKLVNDTYGHIEGDKAILEVAHSLKTTFSGTNAFISRYGGDEFAIVFEASLADIERHLETLNATLLEFSKQIPYNLSVSSGYAKFGQDGIEKVEGWIKAADNRMYLIKKNKHEFSKKNSNQVSTSGGNDSTKSRTVSAAS